MKNIKLIVSGVVGAVVAASTIAATAFADTPAQPAPPAAPAPSAPAPPANPSSPTTPAANKHRGHVTAVDTTAQTITIESKAAGSSTFTVTATTKITVNKATATLADVKVGQSAVVTSDDGKTATAITARDRAAK